MRSSAWCAVCGVCLNVRVTSTTVVGLLVSARWPLRLWSRGLAPSLRLVSARVSLLCGVVLLHGERIYLSDIVFSGEEAPDLPEKRDTDRFMENSLNKALGGG